jgi:hypothetical protein
MDKCIDKAIDLSDRIILNLKKKWKNYSFLKKIKKFLFSIVQFLSFFVNFYFYHIED